MRVESTGADCLHSRHLFWAFVPGCLKDWSLHPYVLSILQVGGTEYGPFGLQDQQQTGQAILHVQGSSRESTECSGVSLGSVNPNLYFTFPKTSSSTASQNQDRGCFSAAPCSGLAQADVTC